MSAPAIPGFTYVEHLGSGGFADVFLYEQQWPRQRVAVKVVRPDVPLTDREKYLFTAEANAMARLADHPYIVSVITAGVTAEGGRPFLVMRYCPPPDLGVRVLTSRGDDLTDSDDEMRVAMRQIVGVFSQLEKTRLVKKLKAARDRKRAHGKVEGRKSHAEKHPDVVVMAKRLYRANPKNGERRSLRDIAKALEAAGFRNEFGKPYHPQSIRRMVDGERPKAGGG